MEEFQKKIARPLFIIIFRTKILFSGPYSILTGHTKVESVAYQVLRIFPEQYEIKCQNFKLPGRKLPNANLWCQKSSLKNSRISCFCNQNSISTKMSLSFCNTYLDKEMNISKTIQYITFTRLASSFDNLSILVIFFPVNNKH